MRILGHPLHPPLVHLPVAAFLLTPAADLAALITGDAFFAQAALWLAGTAVVTALAAATAGLADLASERPEGAPLRLVGVHASVMATATTLAGLGLLGRLDATPDAQLAWPGILGAVAALLMLGGAWFGGELVHGHGLGRRR